MRAMRAWFEARGFVEVETAALQVSPGNETHLHAFATRGDRPGGERAPLYLRTSPEFACKKLLAAGEPRIFELARVWRNRERGPLHHPEFTLLEWYRADEPYEALMDDCAALLALAARDGRARGVRVPRRRCDPFAAPERITVAEAFERFAGDRPDDERGRRRGAGSRCARRARLPRPASASPKTTAGRTSSAASSSRRSSRTSGIGRPTILCEYPLGEAALARPKPGDPRVAERFELYACGVELANCFGELTDPAEQRRRFEADMDEKQRLYGERYPIDEDFLAALAADAARPAAPRSASTAWSCWRPARPASTT